MKAAGVSRRISDDSCAKILQPDLYYPAPLIDARKPPAYPDIPDIVHGKSTIKSESVAKCFNSMKKVGVDEFIRNRNEQIYKSNKLEPLGKSQLRNYSIPLPDHSYGKKCARGVQETVNDVLHPSFDMIVTPKSKPSYVWPASVDSQFAFGYKDKQMKSDRIENALHWDVSSDNPPRNSLNSRDGKPPVQADFTFGRPSRQGDDSAAACISSNFTRYEDLLPDADIGKSIPRIKA